MRVHGTGRRPESWPCPSKIRIHGGRRGTMGSQKPGHRDTSVHRQRGPRDGKNWACFEKKRREPRGRQGAEKKPLCHEQDRGGKS